MKKLGFLMIMMSLSVFTLGCTPKDETTPETGTTTETDDTGTESTDTPSTEGDAPMDDAAAPSDS